MNTELEKQMESVRRKWPLAYLEDLTHGANLVVVPGVKIPDFWKPSCVTIIFRLPPGFPCAQPSDFWTAESMTLGDHDATPYYTRNMVPCPGTNEVWGTHFFWNLQAWNPCRDTIFTYVNVCRQRMESNAQADWNGGHPPEWWVAWQHEQDGD